MYVATLDICMRWSVWGKRRLFREVRLNLVFCPVMYDNFIYILFCWVEIWMPTLECVIDCDKYVNLYKGIACGYGLYLILTETLFVIYRWGEGIKRFLFYPVICIKYKLNAVNQFFRFSLHINKYSCLYVCVWCAGSAYRWLKCVVIFVCLSGFYNQNRQINGQFFFFWIFQYHNVHNAVEYRDATGLNNFCLVFVVSKIIIILTKKLGMVMGFLILLQKCIYLSCQL